VRTLIIGLSLPSVDFDNYTFLGAPSFAEYHQIVVDGATVARQVDDVVSGRSAHATYGGQAIVNGSASAYAFSLRALLDMRKRETEWVLSHGGIVALMASPPVTQPDVEGGMWQSYDWLPETQDFASQADLLAGFGRPGAVLVDAEHPFAPYVQQLAPHVAYRIYLNETTDNARNCHVFARSSGGQAIGFEMPLSGGTMVVLPPLLKPDQERARTAAAISDSIARWNERARTLLKEETT
jgi:hypothetical protein